MGKRREEMQTVNMDIYTWGFNKAFQLSEYPDIENKTFHRLRLRYLKAREQLRKYVENHSPEGRDVEKD